MHEQQYAFMRPPDIVAARDHGSICYVPLGPLEWHGPHLPYGVDMLHAYTLASEAARETGGVVLPPPPPPPHAASAAVSVSVDIIASDARVIFFMTLANWFSSLQTTAMQHALFQPVRAPSLETIGPLASARVGLI